MLLTFSHNDRISFFKDLFSFNSRLSKGKEWCSPNFEKESSFFNFVKKDIKWQVIRGLENLENSVRTL